MSHRFLEAIASGAAAAHALASRQINQVQRSLDGLSRHAVAASDEELEDAVRAGGTLVAPCGGGCARVEGAVQQTRDCVLAVNGGPWSSRPRTRAVSRARA